LNWKGTLMSAATGLLSFLARSSSCAAAGTTAAAKKVAAMMLLVAILDLLTCSERSDLNESEFRLLRNDCT
jgi:hypothetical protein